MKKVFPFLLIFLFSLSITFATWYPAPVWNDEFNDTVIDPNLWAYKSSQIYESGGTVNVDRSGDFISSYALDTIYNWNMHHSLNTSKYFRIDVGINRLNSRNSFMLLGQQPIMETGEDNPASPTNNFTFVDRFGYHHAGSSVSFYILPNQNGDGYQSSNPYPSTYVGNCPATAWGCSHWECQCQLPNHYGLGWTNVMPAFSLVYNESGYFFLHHATPTDTWSYGLVGTPVTLTTKLNYMAWGDWGDQPALTPPHQMDYVRVYQYVECLEDWQRTDSCQIDDTTTILYLDSNNCDTYYWLPQDNGTITSCDYCTPDWSCDSYAACLTNDTQECNSVIDSNTCYAQTGLPSDQYSGDYSEFITSCDYCTPSWSCNGYEECTGQTEANCVSVIDSNDCYFFTGLPSDDYSGNYSEFPPQVCDYPAQSESDNSFFVTQNLQKQSTKEGQVCQTTNSAGEVIICNTQNFFSRLGTALQNVILNIRKSLGLN